MRSQGAHLLFDVRRKDRRRTFVDDSLRYDREAMQSNILKMLAAGPLAKWKLGPMVGLDTERLLRELVALRDAKQIKRIGQSRVARWALASWEPAPNEPAVPHTTKFSIQPKPKPPVGSWWVDVPRAKWRAVAADQESRMAGASVNASIKPIMLGGRLP